MNHLKKTTAILLTLLLFGCGVRISNRTTSPQPRASDNRYPVSALVEKESSAVHSNSINVNVTIDGEEHQMLSSGAGLWIYEHTASDTNGFNIFYDVFYKYDYLLFIEQSGHKRYPDSGTLSIGIQDTIAVASVTVIPDSATINVDESIQLQATLRDADGNILTGPTLTWSSNSPSVAEVNNTGVVTGLSSGSTTITATAGQQSGTAEITVQLLGPPPPPLPPNLCLGQLIQSPVNQNPTPTFIYRVEIGTNNISFFDNLNTIQINDDVLIGQFAKFFAGTDSGGADVYFSPQGNYALIIDKKREVGGLMKVTYRLFNLIDTTGNGRANNVILITNSLLAPDVLPGGSLAEWQIPQECPVEVYFNCQNPGTLDERILLIETSDECTSLSRNEENRVGVYLNTIGRKIGTDMFVGRWDYPKTYDLQRINGQYYIQVDYQRTDGPASRNIPLR